VKSQAIGTLPPFLESASADGLKSPAGDVSTEMMSDSDHTGHGAGTTMETADDGRVRTTVTATVPDCAVSEVAVRVANADGDLSDFAVRDLLNDQLRPLVVYETTDGQAGIDAVRELAETLEIGGND
jgi:hypothetical protein